MLEIKYSALLHVITYKFAYCLCQLDTKSLNKSYFCVTLAKISQGIHSIDGLEHPFIPSGIIPYLVEEGLIIYRTLIPAFLRMFQD
jgi:hypothetical protein